MLARFIQRLTRNWPVVVLAWALIVSLTVWLAPRWDDVTYDGDLAYMPESMTSVKAEQLLEKAFPGRRAKSEMVVVASRDDEPLTPDDLRSLDRVAARLHNLLGISCYRTAEGLWRRAANHRKRADDTEADRLFVRADQLQRKALAAWDEAQRLPEVERC